MNKKLQKILNNCYTRLGVSKIHGVGVFAIRPIPKGVCPFADDKEDYQEFKFDIRHIEDKNVAKVVYDFCVKDKGVWYFPRSLNKMGTSYYLNHNDKNPNMKAVGDGDNFVATRNIEVGEELTVDYGTYSENV